MESTQNDEEPFSCLGSSKGEEMIVQSNFIHWVWEIYLKRLLIKCPKAQTLYGIKQQ